MSKYIIETVNEYENVLERAREYIEVELNLIEEQKEEANEIFRVPEYVNCYTTDCTGLVNFDYEKSKKEHDKKMRTYLRKTRRYQALRTPITITYTQRLYVK
jgi:hypothetical protein